jgi:hypothetical protein
MLDIRILFSQIYSDDLVIYQCEVLFTCYQAILSGSSRYGLHRVFFLMPNLRKHVWFRRLGLYRLDGNNR